MRSNGLRVGQSVLTLNLNEMCTEQLKFDFWFRRSTSVKSGHQFSFVSKLATLGSEQPLKSKTETPFTPPILKSGDLFFLMHLIRAPLLKQYLSFK